MARWRLTAPHYLKIEGVKWEYTEVDRATAKTIRRQFPVPQLLNPDDPTDWNYRNGRDDGEIIVSDGNNAQDRDLIFEGPPTPDMVPLDDEAKAISASFKEQWKHPIESLSGTYSQSLLDDLQRQVADLASRPAEPQKVPGMDEFVSTMTQVMKQNQELIAKLVERRV